ncbi:MAG: hypothetical protein PVJ57_12685 [Phycisphaerae bacterium]|jgi:hypothetical protein
MDRVAELYQWLATGPSPVCERILAAGLACAEPAYRQRIVPLLFDRKTEAAWAGLVANYETLTPAEREQLTGDGALLRAGIAAALQRAEPRTRAQALAALRDYPAPGLAYLLPDVLRSTSNEVRRAAGQTLRRVAEHLADEWPRPDWDEERRRVHAHNRSEMAKALRIALRTYDLHYCADAVEVSLWFADDLGDELWRLLTNRRSQCGNIASTQLKSWNSPRLASFLLTALGHSEWRFTAAQLLRSWSQPDEVAAVLRCAPLLDDPTTEENVAGLKRPHWFDRFQRNLDALPPDLRTAAPRWLCAVGFEEVEQADLLCRWLGTPDRAMQRACVYALAELDTPLATERLRQLAEGRSTLATFARWYLAGQTDDDDETSAAPKHAPAGREAPEVAPPPADEPDDTTEEDLSQFATALPGRAAEDTELINLVRENLDVCGSEVVAFLRSPHAEDRLLGLRILAGVDGENGYVDEVERLLVDSEVAVRDLACEVLKISDQLRSAQEEVPEEEAPPPPARPAATPSGDVRHELRQTLARLLVNEPEADTTVDLVRQIQSLLRRLPGKVPPGDTEERP